MTDVELLASESTLREPLCIDAELAELLRFEAPYVVDRLVERRYVDSAEEGRALLREAIKFLWLCASHPQVTFMMFSFRVDEAWHQFALFTREYTEFGERFFGKYMHHAPSNAPTDARDDGRVTTSDEFSAAYADTFGEALPIAWRDETSISPQRKLLVDDLDRPLTIRVVNDRAELVRRSEDEDVVLVRVDQWAEPALRFIASNKRFFVRELPGLCDEDRVELCLALFRIGVVGPAR